MSRPVTRSMTKAANLIANAPPVPSPVVPSPVVPSVSAVEKEICEESKAIHETANNLPFETTTQFFMSFQELIERAGSQRISTEQVIVVMSFFNRHFHVVNNHDGFSMQRVLRVLGSVLIFCRNMKTDLRKVRATPQNPEWKRKLALELTMDAEVKIMRFIGE